MAERIALASPSRILRFDAPPRTVHALASGRLAVWEGPRAWVVDGDERRPIDADAIWEPGDVPRAPGLQLDRIAVLGGDTIALACRGRALPGRPGEALVCSDLGTITRIDASGVRATASFRPATLDRAMRVGDRVVVQIDGTELASWDLELGDRRARVFDRELRGVCAVGSMVAAIVDGGLAVLDGRLDEHARLPWLGGDPAPIGWSDRYVAAFGQGHVICFDLAGTTVAWRRRCVRANRLVHAGDLLYVLSTAPGDDTAVHAHVAMFGAPITAMQPPSPIIDAVGLPRGGLAWRPWAGERASSMALVWLDPRRDRELVGLAHDGPVDHLVVAGDRVITCSDAVRVWERRVLESARTLDARVRKAPRVAAASRPITDPIALELVEHLLDDPDDAGTLAALADKLQAAGDLRGELIALHLLASEDGDLRRRVLEASLAPPGMTPLDRPEWGPGFIRRLAWSRPPAALLARAVWKHPSMMLLQSLELSATVAVGAPPGLLPRSLRTLSLRDITNAVEIVADLPRLRTLSLGWMDGIGLVAHPTLTKLSVVSRDGREVAKLAPARLPALVDLTLGGTGAACRALLASGLYRQLRRLALLGDAGDDLVALLDSEHRLDRLDVRAVEVSASLRKDLERIADQVLAYR